MLEKRSTIITFFVASLAAFCIVGCDTVPEPDDLDYDRIIAVRAEPPAALATETLVIDALITDSTSNVRVVAPELVQALVPASAAEEIKAMANSLVTRSGDQWTVTVPDEETLAQARLALGIDANEPVPVLLSVLVQGESRSLSGDKLVLLGAAATNPTIESVQAGGIVVTDDIAVSSPAEVMLEVSTGNPSEMSYAWLTSAGELSRFFDARATLTFDEPATGKLLVVARDNRGGVAWRLLTTAAD